MAKFCGFLGYSTNVETSPGIWDAKIVEREVIGDILSITRRWVQDADINDDLTVNNRLSIIADQYCMDHAFEIRYVRMMGAKWKVKSIEVQPPRLILNIGELYTG